MDVRVPESGGDDAVIAGHDGGVGRNDDLLPYRGDQAVADQHGSVVDRRDRWARRRCGVLDRQRALGQLAAADAIRGGDRTR